MLRRAALLLLLLAALVASQPIGARVRGGGVAGSSPPPAVAWDPSRTSPALVLSGDKLTATHTSPDAFATTIAQPTVAIGKYFFQVSVTFSSLAADHGVGLANTLAPFTGTYLANDINSIAYYADGHVDVNNTHLLTTTGYASGQPVCVAMQYDGTATKVWFQAIGSGQWDGNGTDFPATNTGGFDLSGTVMRGGLSVAPAATVYNTGFAATGQFSVPCVGVAGLGGFAPWPGGPPAAQIAGISAGNTTFQAVTGNHGMPIGTATATVTGFDTSGLIWSAATGGECTSSADNSKFAIGASTGDYSIGGTDITAPGTYFFCVQAADARFTNSPKKQTLTLTGSGSLPTITDISPSGTTFTAQAGNAGTQVGTAAAVVTSGSFGGTWALSTGGACTGSADNAAFTVNSSTGVYSLASDQTVARNYNFCLQATDPAFVGSPFKKTITVAGVAAGANIATATFTNFGSTLAAGTPVSLGQVFRYGDIPSGHHPVIRQVDHVTAIPHQWDENSTRTENSQDGSWRHAVWTIQLPVTLTPGQSYTFEIADAAGAYSASSALALGTLCSGGGSHDLKIHLADVRNQDDTVRNSGDATFRLCDNIANTGRDAPRHLRAGPVVDEYMVSGLFKYATTNAFDPLLYAQCIVDLYTDPATGNTLKDVKHVCTIYNSWMKVSAGSTGNAGNPGPAGFANDPQVISYQPEELDGATSILNWTNLTQTVSSASNPITASGACSDTWMGNVTLTVPGSTGNNVWFSGQAVRVSTTGTAVGGLTPGNLYFVYNCGTTNSNGAQTNTVNIVSNPSKSASGSDVLTASQGSGTTTFTSPFWHPHWESIQLRDYSADENWSTAGSTARFTRRVWPTLTATEKRYWEQSGLIMPIALNQTPAVSVQYHAGDFPLYYPFAIGVVVGGSQGGPRPDLGWITEYAAQAWITGNQYDQYLARLFTLAATTHGMSSLLDEATGRIPVLSNGPPTGPGGNGVGGSYGSGANSSVALGAPHTGTSFASNDGSLIYPLSGVPTSFAGWSCGVWAYGGDCQGSDTAHMPAFDNYTYMLYGDRSFLDMMYVHGTRVNAWRRPGPGPGTRDDIQAGNHYWLTSTTCCQGRGSAWLLRDEAFPAALGGDGNIERVYFNDIITENGNYYPQWLNFKDGVGNTQVHSSILPPNFPGSWAIPDVFVIDYQFLATYGLTTFLHASLGTQWLPQYQKMLEGTIGGQLTGALSPYYFIDYTLTFAIHNADTPIGFDAVGNIGASINATDATDFGNGQNYTRLINGNQWQYQSPGYYTFTAGDTVKLYNGAYFGGSLIDQLPGNQHFEIMAPIDNVNGTFYLKCPIGHPVDATCPTPGAAFTGYTRGGVPIGPEDGDYFFYRLSFDPGSGFQNGSYASYGGNMIYGMLIAGQNVHNAYCKFNQYGGASFFGNDSPSRLWDTGILVPGLSSIGTPTCP